MPSSTHASRGPSSRTSRRLALTVACAVALVAGGTSAASVVNALLTIQGNAGGDKLGWSLARAGDVDADGVQDTIVGTAAGGYALVISGRDGSTIHTLKGSPTDQYGYAVAGVGDTDGDGCDDVVVGAPKESSNGAAHLYSGKDGSLLQDYPGDNASDLFGCAVAGIGDVDGDGLADVIVGGRNARDPNTKSSRPGMVKVFLGNGGKNIHTIYGSANGVDFGTAVCGLGDVDGDKAGDFVVGADLGNGGTGEVTLFSGSAGKAIQTIYGDAASDSFGVAVAPAGDVDGDGTTDLMVGASKGADAKGNATGYARVVSGASMKTVHTLYGDASGDLLGTSLAGVEDLDGDGIADLVVGAPGAANAKGEATGAIRIYSGKSGSTIDTVVGVVAGDAFGWSVALIPDVTGDGIADIAVGVPYDDGAGDDAGAAVLLGGTAAPTGTVTINGDAAATTSTSVTLSLSWESGAADVTDMRFRNAGGSWGAWTTVAASAPWTLTANDGVKTVEAEFRDSAGLSSTVASDSITLDGTAPTGSVVIAGGAAWSGGTSVTLNLSYADTGSGVVSMRVRNAGGSFGSWVTAKPTLAWTLATASGSNSVEAEFQDAAGNVSARASDAISVDSVPPTGTILIANGVAGINSRNVTLSLPAMDTGGSGLAEMRLKRGDVATWGNWQPYAATSQWSLAPGDGTKEVMAQFRDVALNESPAYTSSIVLDETGPSVTTFAVHAPRPYYVAGETIGFDLVAQDAEGGTGISLARTSWDGGTTWTPWTDIAGGGIYTPERPALEGAVTAVVVVRDVAGNESAKSAPASLVFVGLDPADLASGGTRKGGMSGAADVDVVGVDLVAGDALTVTLKAAPLPKKQPFVLALDLLRPDGETLVTGKYPANSKVTTIKGFLAPATGRYLIVVRHADAVGTPTGTYTMKVAVKHAKANAAGKGTAGAGEFAFDAADGSALSGTLKGAGIDPASVTIEGPGGAVPVTAKLKKGVVSFGPVKLPAGTGTYTVRFTATGPVAFTWKTALPKALPPIVE